ncbi:bifunctional hydroxymethylpyrimidine kinase/phosphomethylpyrimidine kinase [Deltaproteobacteria bacterium IMCC39524]|nr:bifunctional hydroxymethylpyrimidine kinase/phosphomethylpyrimidine kinase [Deltaproteobacteria bacterium IMCC39524]
MIQGLYLITPQGSDEQILHVVREGLRGGVRVVQYRDKERSADAKVMLARQLVQLCKEAGATFLVNDSAELAVACFADGVHLGQDDGSVHDARKLLGENKVIGVSTRSVDQALKAEMAGVDYIGIGSIFPTRTKDDAELVGLETLNKVRRAVKIPLVAIGGVNWTNASDALDAGADALAVISAVSEDPNPALAAKELALLFNCRKPSGTTRVMTIAGSDSGGGAGIQADLKTITLLGSFGASAITVLTAQNTLGVHGLSPASASFVAKQAEAVITDIGVDTIKTGMLYSAEIVTTVAELIQKHNLLTVVDPVMIAKGGAALLKQDAVEAVRSQLLPCTYLLTPNIPEAEALTGKEIKTLEEMEEAAKELQAMGARHVLLKGGHREEDAIDVLLAGTSRTRLAAERIDTANTHGTGCTYSAALATFIAQGQPLIKAAASAKLFIKEAILHAAPLGGGHGPINHFAGAKAVRDAEREKLQDR